MQIKETSQTLPTELFDETPAAAGAGRYLQLALEGLTYVTLAIVFTHSASLEHAGVISIFLGAAGLSARLTTLLRENRDDIWVHGKGSWPTNRRTAVSVMAVFVGAIVGYASVAVVIGEASALSAFQFALDSAGIGHDTILTRRFGTFLPLLGHNALVLLMFVALAFVYRSYGALLPLLWNACVWGVVLTVLVRRGLAQSDGSAIAFVLIALLALGPHLLLEALGYVVGALAGIFLSKGVSKYGFGDPRFAQVARTCVILFACALGALAVAAGLEHVYAPAVLGLAG